MDFSPLSPPVRTCPTSRRKRTRRSAFRTLAAAAVLAHALPAAGQVHRAGFVPEPNPGTDIVYAAHAFRTGSDVTELRVDVWDDRWGFAVGAGYLSTGNDWSVDGVVMRELRRHGNALSQFGVQAQAGLSVTRADGEWFWEAPLAAGVIIHAEPGALAGHPWLSGQLVVRGGDGDTRVGGGGGAGVRVYMNAGPFTAWGAQLSGGALHIEGRTETYVELSVLRVL